jgi:hypothetical protein
MIAASNRESFWIEGSSGLQQEEIFRWHEVAARASSSRYPLVRNTTSTAKE